MTESEQSWQSHVTQIVSRDGFGHPPNADDKRKLLRFILDEEVQIDDVETEVRRQVLAQGQSPEQADEQVRLMYQLSSYFPHRVP